MSIAQKEILVLRLSSLGDVLISLAFLESLPQGIAVDWIIAKEFAFLLKGHPRVRRVFPFDKKLGMQGWNSLLKETLSVDYDARVDLHVTLRSRYAHWYFMWQNLKQFRYVPWHSISKQRISFVLYLVFKSLTPRFLRPTPFWKRFAQAGAQFAAPEDRDNLKPTSYNFALQGIDLSQYGLDEKKYLCVMPASRWSSKEWGHDRYAELLKWVHESTPLKIVLMGRSSDPSCFELSRKLHSNKTPFISLLDAPHFTVTASVLSKAFAYLGSDTGLAHLSEAVGTRAWVIFGPTRPDLGFGSWKKESVAITSNVFCSPCSKDGKTCYRFWEPYACLKRIQISQVKALIQEQLI